MYTFLGSEMCLCELKLHRKTHFFFDDLPCRSVLGDTFKCAFSFFNTSGSIGFGYLFVYSFTWLFFSFIYISDLYIMSAFSRTNKQVLMSAS